MRTVKLQQRVTRPRVDARKLLEFKGLTGPLWIRRSSPDPKTRLDVRLANLERAQRHVGCGSGPASKHVLDQESRRSRPSKAELHGRKGHRKNWSRVISPFSVDGDPALGLLDNRCLADRLLSAPSTETMSGEYTVRMTSKFLP